MMYAEVNTFSQLGIQPDRIPNDEQKASYVSTRFARPGTRYI